MAVGRLQKPLAELSASGDMVEAAWFPRYTPEELPQKFDQIVQSWDTANKPSELDNSSVCTTFGVRNKRLDWPVPGAIPSLRLGVMDAQIVDDQKNLLLRVLDETLHEIDEDRHVQRALVEPEPHQAAIADCGDHARRELLPGLRQDRRLTFRRVTLADLILVADAGLVAPVDDRLLALRPRAIDG